MTILNESGIPDVLSPLQAVNGLAERLQDALLIVVGTRTEAYLVRSLPAALSPEGSAQPNPRVVSVILDPEEPPEEGRLASYVVEAAAGSRNVALVLLVAGRTAELIGVNADFEARLAARRLDLPVKHVSPDSSAPGCLCTDLEDSVLAALVEICPGTPADTEEVVAAPPKRGFFSALSLRDRSREWGRDRVERSSPVALVGALVSPKAGRELAAELSGANLEVTGNVPGAGAVDLPPVDENTVVALADPYLTAASRAAEERGAEVVRTIMPVGVDGTAHFIRDVASAAGQEPGETGRSREVWKRLEHLRSRIRGKRVFFAGDTGLEIPLARFLADAGAVVLEVGAPRLDRRLLASELQALGSDVDVIQSPDWRGQIERVDAAQPDVVITSPGLYTPLVARGHLCRSSLDLVRAGIHGYEGARRILELLARSLERAEALDSVNL